MFTKSNASNYLHYRNAFGHKNYQDDTDFFLNRLLKVFFLRIFNDFLPTKHVTKIGLAVLDKLRKFS